MPTAEKYCKLTFSYRTVLPDDDIVVMNDNRSQHKCSLCYVGTGNQQTSEKPFPSFSLSLIPPRAWVNLQDITPFCVKINKTFFFSFKTTTCLPRSVKQTNIKSSQSILRRRRTQTLGSFLENPVLLLLDLITMK